jgi:HJR/Mrr/RecB family endonuclease
MHTATCPDIYPLIYPKLYQLACSHRRCALVATSNFPCAHVAAAIPRNAAILDLSQKPLLENPQPGSRILVATKVLSERLIRLHRDPGSLRHINRRVFEELVAELFDGFGYSVELTARTRDGGRDVVALGRKDQIQTRYLIECKRPDPGNPVGVGLVRQLLGVVEDERATKGILVATTYFSPDARSFEKRNEWRLELKDYENVLSWMERYVRLKGQ